MPGQVAATADALLAALDAPRLQADKALKVPPPLGLIISTEMIRQDKCLCELRMPGV